MKDITVITSFNFAFSQTSLMPTNRFKLPAFSFNHTAIKDTGLANDQSLPHDFSAEPNSGLETRRKFCRICFIMFFLLLNFSEKSFSIFWDPLSSPFAIKS